MSVVTEISFLCDNAILKQPEYSVGRRASDFVQVGLPPPILYIYRPTHDAGMWPHLPEPTPRRERQRSCPSKSQL
jgi:hypothetical protein